MARIIKETYSDLKLDPISAKYVNDSITSAKKDMRKVGIPESQINAAADSGSSPFCQAKPSMIILATR